MGTRRARFHKRKVRVSFGSRTFKTAEWIGIPCPPATSVPERFKVQALARRPRICADWSNDRQEFPDSRLPRRYLRVVSDSRPRVERSRSALSRLVFPESDYWQQIERGKRGIGQPNVNGKVLGEIELPLPDLTEQRRIVAEIEKQFTRLEAGVAALRRVQANLKRYRAAVLKAACEGRLVPTEAELAKAENRKFETGEELLARILTERRQNWQGRGKYKEPARARNRRTSAAPGRLDVDQLGCSYCFRSSEWTLSASRTLRQRSSILRIDDYQDGWVRAVDELKKVAADQADVHQVSTTARGFGDQPCQQSDAILGSALLSMNSQHVGALFESNMMKAHLADCVNNRYVEYYLRSRDGRSRLISGREWAVNQATHQSGRR